ncbi:MAG TPA: hypothetical protein ACFYD3_04275 [Candidatus Hypogeohydataceae bacterium YC41]
MDRLECPPEVGLLATLIGESADSFGGPLARPVHSFCCSFKLKSGGDIQMRNLIFALCVPLFLSLSLIPAEGQEVRTIDIKGLNDLLAANKGKVVVLDFWTTF